MVVIRDIRAGGAAEFVSRPPCDYSLRGLVIRNGMGQAGVIRLAGTITNPQLYNS